MSFPRYRMLFGLCASASMVLPATAEPPSKPNDREVAQWIKELGADDFAVREKASRQLWLAGPVAETALEKAFRSDDAEVVRRARAILDKFRWGIYPDTPANVVALIRIYQSSTGDVRPQDLDKLLQSGSAGLRAVLQFAQSQKQPDQREVLVKLVAHKMPAAFQRAFSSDDDWERFDAVIALAYDRKCVPDNHYVAYWLLRGKLQERIAQFRSLTANNPSEHRFAQTLAYLYRAGGDRKRACAAAEKAKQNDLLLGLLIEAAEWKTLAVRPGALDGKSTSEKWGYRLAFARLAGNRRDFESAVGEVLQQAAKERNWSPARRVARTFLLNDRPDEALALLAKSPDQQTELFELLCARKQYREALALADKPRPAGDNEQHYLDLLKARTLYQLGEKDRARALFVEYGKRIKEGVKGFWAERLLAEEQEVGLKDLAFEHCARIQSVEADWGEVSPAWGVAPFLRQVFPNRSESATIWWNLLRQKFPDDSLAGTLKRLRDLFEGKTEARTVKQWIAEVERGDMRARLSPPGSDGVRRGKSVGKVPVSAGVLPAGDPHWQALADTALAAGLDDLAGLLLKKADTLEALIRLGDVLAEKKCWAEAAERYRQAWCQSQGKVDPFTEEEQGNPLPLFLAGHALRMAGRQSEGDKLIDQAHAAPLGNELIRYNFLRALEDRGHVQAMLREADLLSRVSEPSSFYYGGALRPLGTAAAHHKQYRKAADYCEQAMLRFFLPTAFFNQTASYITVPARIHCLRAASLLADGKHDEATRHMNLALTLTPGNVEVAVTLVPELERRDRKREADALFQRCLDPHEKVCRDYPRCASSHNSAAWLSACCRRNLDKALAHAQKAVELAPNNAGYFDTLAEIHFQRGDKDKAIASEKHAIELDPKRSYYGKQLKRLEAGDSTAERPPEDGD